MQVHLQIPQQKTLYSTGYSTVSCKLYSHATCVCVIVPEGRRKELTICLYDMMITYHGVNAGTLT